MENMTKIKGNHDGPNGSNNTYNIGYRKNVPRSEVVKEILEGKYPGAHVYTRNGQKYARDNPDKTISDNVNRKK